jgi:sigma-B regulation protein RsbU (phosphoserine phosphatase)
LDSQGTPLGILAAAELKLSEEQINLKPGDRLVLYTDGLADVESRRGNLYGRRRLKSLVEENSGLQPEELCGFVFEKLLAFQGGGEQFDDMAMLVIALAS